MTMNFPERKMFIRHVIGMIGKTKILKVRGILEPRGTITNIFFFFSIEEKKPSIKHFEELPS